MCVLLDEAVRRQRYRRAAEQITLRVLGWGCITEKWENQFSGCLLAGIFLLALLWLSLSLLKVRLHLCLSHPCHSHCSEWQTRKSNGIPSSAQSPIGQQIKDIQMYTLSITYFSFLRQSLRSSVLCWTPLMPSTGVGPAQCALLNLPRLHQITKPGKISILNPHKSFCFFSEQRQILLQSSEEQLGGQRQLLWQPPRANQNCSVQRRGLRQQMYPHHRSGSGERGARLFHTMWTSDPQCPPLLVGQGECPPCFSSLQAGSSSGCTQGLSRSQLRGGDHDIPVKIACQTWPKAHLQTHRWPLKKAAVTLPEHSSR